MNVHLVLDHKPTRTNQKLKTFSNYLQQYPSGWKKRLELAHLLYQMGRWQEAVEEYGKVLQREPCLMEVRLQMGKIFHLMGKDTEAIAVYEEALSLCHNTATKHHLKGLIELYRHRPMAAVKLFQSAADLEPSNPAHYHAMGQVYQEIESPLAALQAFDAALSLNPHDVVAASQSYEPLLAVGKFKQARQRLEQVLKLCPNDCPTLQQLATHRCLQGLVTGEEGKQTKGLIKTALALAPHSATSHQVFSLYHLCRGKWDKAIRTAGRVLVEHYQDGEQGCRVSAHAVELQPNLPEAWFLHGRVLALAGRHGEATDALERGWQTHPLLPSAAVWLGESYQALGHESKSRKWWQEAWDRAQALMEFNPTTAYYWQGRALLALGDVRGARKAYRSALSGQLLYPARGEVKEAMPDL